MLRLIIYLHVTFETFQEDVKKKNGPSYAAWLYEQMNSVFTFLNPPIFTPPVFIVELERLIAFEQNYTKNANFSLGFAPHFLC